MKIQTVNHKNLNRISTYFLFFIVLCGYQFADFVFFPPTIIKAFSMLGIILIFITCFRQIFTLKRLSVPYTIMQYYLLLYLISAVSCWINNEQSISHSFLVVYRMLYISFFFLLVKYKVDIFSVEKLFSRIGQIHVVLFLIALSVTPFVLFGTSDGELDNSRGAYRVGVQFGWDCFILYYFYFLNRWRNMKPLRYWIFLTALIIIIIYHLTRTTILSVGMVTVLFFLFKLRSYYRLVPVLLFAGFYFLGGDMLSKNSVVQGLLETSNTQISSNAKEDDIRIYEYKYFFNDYNDSWETSFFGNGAPHTESKFGKRAQYIRNTLRVFESDVGWAAIYIMFGWLGLAFTVCWLAYMLVVKIPDNYYYLKLIAGYYIIGNITAGPTFSHVFSVSISLYILHCILKDKKNVFAK